METADNFGSFGWNIQGQELFFDMSDIEQENTILVFAESYKEGKRQKKNASSCTVI
jgi:hypothetical protein